MYICNTINRLCNNYFLIIIIYLFIILLLLLISIILIRDKYEMMTPRKGGGDGSEIDEL